MRTILKYNRKQAKPIQEENVRNHSIESRIAIQIHSVILFFLFHFFIEWNKTQIKSNHRLSYCIDTKWSDYCMDGEEWNKRRHQKKTNNEKLRSLFCDRWMEKKQMKCSNIVQMHRINT